jgi:hypothetical protein
MEGPIWTWSMYRKTRVCYLCLLTILVDLIVDDAFANLDWPKFIGLIKEYASKNYSTEIPKAED